VSAAGGQGGRRQHLLLALLVVWLAVSSPWVHMLRQIPRNAGWLDYAHVGLGVLASVLALTYIVACFRGGGWRIYLPWLSGRMAPAMRELRALPRGELPTAEGGGLFALIEGLLLLATLATGLTGVAWLVLAGTPEAVAWRGYHILAAQGMIALLVLHVITVSLHLLDFIRE
jgi:hypothetical protein